MIGLLPFVHVWKLYLNCQQQRQMPCTVLKCAISISEPIRQFLSTSNKNTWKKSKTFSGRPRDADAGDA
ncbi:hypothetical protein DPMN_075255 [Dreissena polymorpha]|uniref:Uncharacterized protein n=1 Tax=Dreissena polymorpha TaxID=45954 RepID=A0A9D3YHS5_DREPO|nr:hypothetical protein DPMN_075255 [Dreissena polymorpha]